MLAAAYFFYTNTHSEDVVDSLTFSNTQEEDWSLNRYLPKSDEPKQVAQMEMYLSQISLPQPPANSSATTTAELRLLHQFVQERTEAAQNEVEAELDFNNFRFDEYLVGTTTKPHTSELITTAHETIIPLIITFKRTFDRVRPSYLDPTLTTTIPVPSHAAYPSGHATEAHLVAYLLAELDPENREAYLADAARIAHNREIAGVHYPSDSTAGKSLAAQFTELFLSTENGAKLLEAARTEWH